MEQTRYPRLGEEVVRHTLPNGLAIYVVKKPGFRQKYALFATRYGGMDLRFRQDGTWLDTPAGIAHYLEHKMFDTAEGNALQELALRGAEPNAFTSNAMTAYYFDSTEHFIPNLKTLLSFVSVPYFTEESVAKEQGIIGQEIGMIEDDPGWQVYKNLMRALYPGSPASIPVAGSVESIRHITAETLYDCHRAFYTPGNMCLVAVGDVDAAEIIDAAREILPAEGGAPVERDYAGGDGKAVTPLTERVMEVARPQFLVGFRCPDAPEGPERLRANVIGDLAVEVLSGESSPLYSRLYTQGLINGSFDSGFDLLPGVAYVYAGGESGDPAAVADAIRQEAARVVAEGVGEDYYQRLRRAMFGASLKGLNSFESIALSMVEGCFHGFDAYRFPEVFDTVRKQDVLDFIRENICGAPMAMSVVRPKEE